MRGLRFSLFVVVLLAVQAVLTSSTFAAGPVPATARHVAAAGPGYLTIAFGRSMWVATDKRCHTVAGTVNLGTVAQDLKARGMKGVGTVEVDRALATGQMCFNGSLYSGWSDLATLRDTYGWTFVSDGLTHGDITTMTPAQQNQDSCGSLSTFTSHGHNSAWGMYAYADNRFSTTVQQNVVRTCFAYGRTYAAGKNVRSKMAAPWFQRTNSVLGGSCNTPGQPCYTISGSKHYASVSKLVSLVQVQGDRWVDLQFYRLVTGFSGVAGLSWDCTSTDWTLHWTSEPELYCQNDFDSIVSQVPAGVVVTDPATVATAWGRAPG